MSDPTRLISAALQNHETSGGNRFLIHIDDPIANDLDVMGNNEYMGWYVRRPEDADLTDLASKYDKPSS